MQDKGHLEGERTGHTYTTSSGTATYKLHGPGSWLAIPLLVGIGSRVGYSGHSFVARSTWNSFALKIGTPDTIMHEEDIYDELDQQHCSAALRCFGAFVLDKPLVTSDMAILVLEEGEVVEDVYVNIIFIEIETHMRAASC